jgi:acyl dehydratase
MTDSLIPTDTMALIGTPLGAPVMAAISAKESQRYAHAVDDLNPIYFDEAAARAAGYRTLVAPPTFVSHAVVQGRPLAELRVDGLFRTVSVKLNVKRIMFGGEEWDFLEPVCVGDTITAETRLADLDQKDGSKGPFVRMVRETTYTNQDGETVARTRQIGIAR